MNCDWCDESINIMTNLQRRPVHERVVFYGDGGDPNSSSSPSVDLNVHIRCAKYLHERGVKVKKYILASAADYPTRPDATPVMRDIEVRFTEEQWSKLCDLASWNRLDPEKYLALIASEGQVHPGRQWSLENDRRLSPEDKAKTIAIPKAATDVDKRGNVIRTLKSILPVAPPPNTTTNKE